MQVGVTFLPEMVQISPHRNTHSIQNRGSRGKKSEKMGENPATGVIEQQDAAPATKSDGETQESVVSGADAVAQPEQFHLPASLQKAQDSPAPKLEFPSADQDVPASDPQSDNPPTEFFPSDTRKHGRNAALSFLGNKADLYDCLLLFSVLSVHM